MTGNAIIRRGTAVAMLLAIAGMLAGVGTGAGGERGAACWDFIESRSDIPDCSEGAVCWNECDPHYPDWQLGTTWEGAYGELINVWCFKGKVKIDQWGICRCFHDPNALPTLHEVVNLVGTNPCPR